MTGAVHADALKLPASVPDPDALASPGWSVELAIEGELNSDTSPDRAVVLLQDEGAAEDRARVLVVLLGQAKGFTVAASNARLLACFGCLGMKGGDAQPNIEIVRGVMSITQNGGSRHWYGSVHKFRFDKRERRLVLIGLDDISGDGGTGEEKTTSTNYLTARRIVTHTPPQVDDDGKELPVNTSEQTQKFEREPLLKFEDVRSAFGD